MAKDMTDRCTAYRQLTRDDFLNSVTPSAVRPKYAAMGQQINELPPSAMQVYR